MSANTHPEMKIANVHLAVANVERSLRFYHTFLGLPVAKLTSEKIIFLTADTDHHVTLSTWSRAEEALPSPPGHSGLYHFSILFAHRRSLARIVKKIIAFAYPIDGALDYGDFEGIYLRDPDGIPVELYRNIPKEEWKKLLSGEPQYPKAIDLESLLQELQPEKHPATS